MPEVNLENDKESESEKKRDSFYKAQNELTLQLPKKWLGHLWRHFKSLDLWTRVITGVLTAVLGGLLTAYFLAEGKPNEGNNCVAEELITEINYRAGWGTIYLGDLKQHNKSSETLVLELDTYKFIQQVVDQMVYIGRHKNSHSKCALSKMRSLLLQLSPLSVHDNSEGIILDGAIASTVKLESMYDNIRASNSHTTVDDFIEGVTKQLENLTAVTGTIYLTNGENSD